MNGRPIKLLELPEIVKIRSLKTVGILQRREFLFSNTRLDHLKKTESDTIKEIIKG